MKSQKKYMPHGKGKDKAQELTPQAKRRKKLIALATKHETFRTERYLLPLLLKQMPYLFNGTVLDPSAGDGRWLRSILKSKKHRALRKLKHCLNDIAEGEKDKWESFNATKLTGDYLKRTLKKKYGTAVTNPPFSKSQAFVDKMLDDVKEKGHVIILEKLSFDTGIKRAAWMKKMPLKYIVTIPWRLQFEIDGLGKDELIPVTYCHAFFVFQKGLPIGGPVIRIHLERKAKRKASK